jgi:hypothetical protein
MPNVSVRADLVAAQQAAWRQVTSPGASYGGAERWAIAAVALAALDDAEPLAPWVSPTQAGRTSALLASAAGVVLPDAVVLPDVVVDATYRIARHAATLTEAWYREVLARGIDPVAYVELVGIVCVVAAVDGFYRAIGTQRPPLPAPTEGVPHGQHPQVEPATLNWVLVATPADQVASVVQGLSAAPAELENVKRLAAVQYIPFDEMGDLSWNRGTLSRGETELVAARLSSARECFF